MKIAMSCPCLLFSALIACPILAAEGSRLFLSDALQEALNNNRSYRISDTEARAAAEQVSWGRAGALPKAAATSSRVPAYFLRTLK